MKPNDLGLVCRTVSRLPGALALAATLLSLWPAASQAIPLFNRQTGQNCVACHAGGQFPELTPYGRLFKLTGYTIGERTLPVSAMALASYSKVADTGKSDDPSSDFSKNAKPILATASLFLGGKVNDNIGAFVQITYDNYAGPNDAGHYVGHTNADNIDLRYADRFIGDKQDLIFGVSANNNPSVTDPWNTAAAWMQYVPVPSPGSSRFIDGNSPYPGYGAGGNIAGINAYVFWNQMVYAEVGGYRSATGLFSPFSAGLDNAGTTRLRGINPYWRVALNHEWGAHSLMLGAAGMTAKVYDNPIDTSDPNSVHQFRDLSLDAQYQYLLDPHAVTAQLVWTANRHRVPGFLAGQDSPFVDASGNALASSNAEDTTHVLRARISYVYQARYGAGLGWFNLSGNTDTANQSSGFDPGTLSITSDLGAGAPSTRVGGNLSGNPGTRGGTLEAFWTPVQNLRIGAQYTIYNRFNGAASNYDGFGRDASDNNSLFLYTWLAF